MREVVPGGSAGVILLIVWGERRNLWPRLFAAAIVAAVVLAVVTVLLSPHRNDLATQWGFVAGVVAPAAGVVIALLRKAKQQDEKQRDRTPDPGELDKAADELAKAVREEWDNAAGEQGLLAAPIPVRWRFEAEMAAPITAAVKPEHFHFRRLPKIRPVNEQVLREGGGIRDLHAMYGGLRSGRLVIAGPEGSGKTGAAVLLLLEALQHRAQLPDDKRQQVPVPVLFTFHDWDPIHERVQDWLIRQLQRTYSDLLGEAGRRKAAELIAAKRVAVILDGLDEMAEELRPVALQELNKQATAFRIVVLARSGDMVSVASQQVLIGSVAVELQRIGSEVAADYLASVKRDAPGGWRDLVDRIRNDPDGPLAQALSTPLHLTLLRDTYDSEDDVRDLIAISDAADGHMSESDDDLVKRIRYDLLDRLLRAAYKERPEKSLKYDLDTAEKALRHIAVQMNQDRSYDLEWWRIPEWSPLVRRAIPAGLVAGILAWLVTWLVSGFGAGLLPGFIAAVAAYAAAGGFGWRAAYRGIPPWTPGGIRLRRALSRGPLAIVFASGLVFGVVGGLLGSLATRNVIGMVLGVVAGLALALASGLLFGLRRLDGPSDNTSFVNPLTSWETARRYGRMLGLTFGLLGALCGGLAFGLLGWGVGGVVDRVVPQLASKYAKQLTKHLTRREAEYIASHHINAAQDIARQLTTWFEGPFVGLRLQIAWMLLGGLFGVLLFGLIGGLGAPIMLGTWPSTVASVELAMRWHTPVQLMDFLEDARKRGVLRTVGPVYQFRHRQLQDLLAKQAAPDRKTADKDDELARVVYMFASCLNGETSEFVASWEQLQAKYRELHPCPHCGDDKCPGYLDISIKALKRNVLLMEKTHFVTMTARRTEQKRHWRGGRQADDDDGYLFRWGPGISRVEFRAEA
jgi:hypothetical protein